MQGIIRYVEPLPMPASRKITMKDAKKIVKLCSLTPTIAVTVNSASPRNTANVTRAPPILSDSSPPSGRATDPMSAPRKPRPARYVAMNGWWPRNSGKVFLMTSGSANA